MPTSETRTYASITRPRSSRISRTSARPLDRGALVMYPDDDSRCMTATARPPLGVAGLEVARSSPRRNESKPGEAPAEMRRTTGGAFLAAASVLGLAASLLRHHRHAPERLVRRYYEAWRDGDT